MLTLVARPVGASRKVGEMAATAQRTAKTFAVEGDTAAQRHHETAAGRTDAPVPR